MQIWKPVYSKHVYEQALYKMTISYFFRDLTPKIKKVMHSLLHQYLLNMIFNPRVFAGLCSGDLEFTGNKR